jgi:DNA-binding beta-propeller fold protein YncE
MGVDVDGAGNVYVVDGGNKRVIKYSSSGTYLLEWGQNGTSESRLNDPNRIHIDQTEKVYVVDSGGNCVNVYSSNGEFIDKYVGAGGEALFGHPLAVAVDDSGYIYVSDHIDDYDGQEYIKKFAPDGTFITRWGGRGSGDGQLSKVESLVVDREGYVYVSDGENNRIQKFTSTGVFVKKWGTYGSDDGQFQSPFGINLDNSGLLYVADLKNHRIQKFTSEGKFIMTWGEQGSGDYQFVDAADVAVDSQGNVFVADQANNRIVKFRPRGSN